MKKFRVESVMRIVLLFLLIVLGGAQIVKADDAALVKYSDPQGRFTFSYPSTFGTPEKGTNDGFGDRVAAVRFSEFSSGVHNGAIVLGGEAALTKGFVMVDIQALGGLYDSIEMEVFPEALRKNIISNLPALTAENFREAFTKDHHVDINDTAFASFDQRMKDAIVGIDQTRNIDPKVIRCDVDGDTVTFHKEATIKFNEVENRNNIYGAIRFLHGLYSSFQIIRVTAEAPTPEMLNDITAVVKSFKEE